MKPVEKSIKERNKMLLELAAYLKGLKDKKEIQETKAIMLTISGAKRVTMDDEHIPRYITRAKLWLTGKYQDDIIWRKDAPTNIFKH